METTMRILAIDPAGRTGLAWTDSGIPQGHLVETLDSRNEREPGKRYLLLWKKLCELAPQKIIFEELRFGRGGKTDDVLSGYRAVIRLWCAVYHAPYQTIGASSLKKYATGYGKATKQDMIDKARDLFGYAGNSDDEADALHMLRYATDPKVKP